MLLRTSCKTIFSLAATYVKENDTRFFGLKRGGYEKIEGGNGEGNCLKYFSRVDTFNEIVKTCEY